MRISTAIMTGLVFTATTSVAWSLGAREPANQELLVPLETLPTETAATPNPPQGDTGTSAATESATTSSTDTNTGNTNPSTAPAPTASQNPATTQPKLADTATAQPVVVTKTSDVITYKYGVVQISLTKTDGTITDVTLLQGDASYGRDVAYAALINATIQVQGTSYGNVSGATFTTDAFKKAVENVLSKF